ncbi:MAG: helix-turn-helix domain-containing protein [Proteobacteria bacterium]|nr:helix-turn-helix domain-containing protein [Pseudomonadota bacterium]
MTAKWKGREILRIVRGLDGPKHFVAHVLSRSLRPGDERDATEALAAAVGECYRALKNLRRQTFFKNAVGGGIAAPEAKYNPRLRRWDVHFHLILDVQDLDVTRADTYWRKNEAEGRTWGRPKRMNDATVARAVAMRSDGRTLRQIAVALKVPKSTVGRALASQKVRVSEAG